MTEEQRALLAKARASNDAARLLLDSGYADFAVSRAYYAMFYCAEALLLGEGLTFSKHSAVHSAFGRRFAKTGRAPTHLHRYLLEAAAHRNDSDYTLASGVTHTEAGEEIVRADEFIAVAQSLLAASDTGA